MQEALTNTLKHAGHTHTALTVSWEPERHRLTLRLCDDGPRQGDEDLAPAAQADEGFRPRAGWYAGTDRRRGRSAYLPATARAADTASTRSSRSPPPNPTPSTKGTPRMQAIRVLRSMTSP